MPGALWTDPRTKPPVGWRVNPLHRLAPYTCWLLNEGAGALANDAVLGVRTQPFFNVDQWLAPGAGGFGSALRFVAARTPSLTTTVMSTRLAASQANRPCSFCCCFRSTAAVGSELFGEGQSAGTGYSLAKLDLNYGTPGLLRFFMRNEALTTVNASGAGGVYNDGAWHIAHGVNEGQGNQVRVYADGLLLASAANTMAGPLTCDQSRIGNRAQGPDNQSVGSLDGDVSFAMSWNRALSAAEVAEHVRAPFLFFEPARVSQAFYKPPVRRH
jgi:hypothetical protein